MDLVSATASIIALIDGTYRLVEFLSDFKDGGKERMKLLAEVSNMACTLDSLREKLDQNLPTQGLLTLIKPGGPIDQCISIVATLTKELAPKDAIAGRTVQRLRWSFKKEDVYHAVEQLHRIQATIAQQIALAITEQIQHDSATARQILDDQEEQRIRNWLSPLNFVAQQKAVYESHCPGTGARLLKSKQFDAWKRSSESILWCTGPPGAGKTYLSSIMVHELQKTSQAEGDIVLVVYCRYNDPECQDLANIVGDLLKQCLKSRPVPDSLVELFRTHCSTDTRPTYETLLQILFEQLQSYRKCYIVIDALDELANPNDRSLLVTGLQPLQAGSTAGGIWKATRRRAPQNTTPRSVQVALSLIILSRDLEDIKAAVRPINFCDCCWGGMSISCKHCDDCQPGFTRSDYLYNCQSCALPSGTIPGGYDVCQSCYDAGVRCPEEAHPEMIRRVNNFVFEVSADKEDLRQYLQWRTETESSLKILLKKKDGLQNQVFDAVVSSSGFMFLMAKLTIDVLATCLTIKELKLALSNIPSGLRFAYDATIQRILNQGPSRSRRAFELMKWVLHAKRPLKSAEIEHAVSIEHESEDIDRDDIVPASTLASLCAGLVVIDEYGDFRFIHQTVSEYLTKHHSEKFHDADGFLAESCLVYLGYKEFAQGPCEDIYALQARRLQYPAYSYCARYWHQHLMGRDALCEGLKKAALKIFESEPHWRSAFQNIKASRDSLSNISENDTILHLGAYLDAHLLFGDLMRLDRTCLNRQNSHGDSPLIVAAWYGGLNFASSLLEAGAEVDIREEFGHNALHLAVLADRQDLADLLIVNPRVNINSTIAMIQTRDGGQTALIIAAQNGYVKIVDRLLKAGAEVNTLDNGGISALYWAVLKNHPQVVDLLIAAPEIDINNRDGYPEDEGGGQSALMLAARKGNVEIVTSLISAGADLTMSDHKGRAALHVAAETDNVAVVEFLVRSLISGRADLNQVDNTGNTALHYAASMGRVAVVEILVKSLISIRADLTIFNDTGNTALHVAVEMGHVAVVEVLVSNGMDVDLLQAKPATEDDVGDLSAVMIASVKGHVDTLEILLPRSRNIDLCNSKKRTALLIAIFYQQVEAAKLLLSQKMINIELADDSRGTPLIVAATFGISSIIPDLVARGAQLNRRTDLVCSPIIQAVAHGHTETARTLLSIPGIDVNAISPWTGRTPLHYAVSWGNAELVELLISHGADLHIRDNVNGFRPIEYALYFNDQRILDLLRASDP